MTNKEERKYQQMKQAYLKPTHAWIGRAECGCCLAVATASPDLKQDANRVKEMILSGLVPERVTWERYQEIAGEAGFMGCIHEKETKCQPGLFG